MGKKKHGTLGINVAFISTVVSSGQKIDITKKTVTYFIEQAIVSNNLISRKWG